MKFATLNNIGQPTGFYSSEFHNIIPEDVIEITDEQWKEFLDNQGTRIFRDGEVVEYIPEILEKDIINTQIMSYNHFLKNTDHKMITDYEPTHDEDIKDIINKRKEARDFIRANIIKE
jgi:hypothetical protein